MDCVAADLATLELLFGIHEMAFGFHRRLVDRFPFAIYYLVGESFVTPSPSAPLPRAGEGRRRRGEGFVGKLRYNRVQAAEGLALVVLPCVFFRSYRCSSIVGQIPPIRI